MTDEFGTEIMNGWTLSKYSDPKHCRGRSYFNLETGWVISGNYDGWLLHKTSQDVNDVDKHGWRRQESLTPNGYNPNISLHENDLGKPYHFNSPEEAMIKHKEFIERLKNR